VDPILVQPSTYTGMTFAICIAIFLLATITLAAVILRGDTLVSASKSHTDEIAWIKRQMVRADDAATSRHDHLLVMIKSLVASAKGRSDATEKPLAVPDNQVDDKPDTKLVSDSDIKACLQRIDVMLIALQSAMLAAEHTNRGVQLRSEMIYIDIAHAEIRSLITKLSQ